MPEKCSESVFVQKELYLLVKRVVSVCKNSCICLKKELYLCAKRVGSVCKKSSICLPNLRLLTERAPRGPGWTARGRPGVQNWNRFLVHPYACRTVLGARWYPHKHTRGGVHGYSSFGWIALVVALQDKKGTLRWLAGLAGLGWAGLNVPYINIYL